MKAALERFAKSWVLESENIRAYFVSGSYSVSFMFCMLMLALQRKGFWQSSLLGKLQTPPMTSLQPWDRTARIKWAQKRQKIVIMSMSNQIYERLHFAWWVSRPVCSVHREALWRAGWYCRGCIQHTYTQKKLSWIYSPSKIQSVLTY